MPELPEVETLRRSLEPVLLGRRLVDVRVFRRDVISVPGEPLRRISGSRHLLVGALVTQVQRRGKQIAIVADHAAILVVHLGMTGQLLCEQSSRRGPTLAHVHIAWMLDSGNRLIFRDPRRFGHVWALPSLAALDDAWARLGPDALGITSDHLRRAGGGSHRAVKAVLLDQEVLAGVGNIYADEALFAAGIRPTAPACRLSPIQWTVLARAIRQTLTAAIAARGTTLRDYRDASGQPGTAQLLHRVYGRGGDPCFNCGKRLTQTTVCQRTTVYCPRCQREPTS